MRFLIVVIISMFYSLAGAEPRGSSHVDIKTTKPLFEIPVDNVTQKITSKDIAQFIPLDIAPTSSSSIVVNKIADKSLTYLMNNSAMKDNAVLKTANSLQDKVKADIEIAPTSPGATSHRFTLKYEVFQALAKFEYKGWLQAAVNYDSKAAETDVVVQEKLFSNKNVYLKQKISSSNSTSSVGVSWAW